MDVSDFSQGSHVTLLSADELSSELLSRFESGYDVKIWNEGSFSNMLEHFRSLNGELLQVMVDGSSAGVAGLLPFKEAGKDAWETFIYLMPEYRRKGVAKVLLHSFGVAGNLSGVALWSDVRVDNEASIATHEFLFDGLEVEGVFESPSGYMTRRWLVSNGDRSMLPFYSRWLVEDLCWALGRGLRRNSI